MYPTVLISYLRPGKITLAREKTTTLAKVKTEMAKVKLWSI